MKYFGTDGIRGVVGCNLNTRLIRKVARALALYFRDKKNKVLLVGNDSRSSSDFILSTIESIVLRAGIMVENLGVCSSPCLAYLAKKENYPLAMMISASHNSSEYNGIKFFNSNGEKVGDKFEEEFEILMDKKFYNKKSEYAFVVDVSHKKSEYIEFLKSKKISNYPCIVDCAYGGTSSIAKAVFNHQKIINARPTGTNINLNCGCTHVELLKRQCIMEQKIGIAVDGDGDRVILISKSGEEISGDKILFLLSKFYLHKGDILVGTTYTNMGLELALKKRGIKLIRANVGDKFVYKKMCENSCALGGENSGHIIIKTHSNTGDGLLNSILVMNILSTSKCEIEDLLADYNEYYQVHKNIKITNKFVLNSALKNLIETEEKNDSRIVIRESGTEPLLRVMVENKNKTKAEKVLEKIVNSIYF